MSKTWTYTRNCMFKFELLVLCSPSVSSHRPMLTYFSVSYAKYFEKYVTTNLEMQVSNCVNKG